MAKKLPVYWAPQAGPQTLAAIAPVDELLFGGTRGGGKALRYQALIATPFGWTQLKDLKLGDQITNPVTGGVERVIGIYPQGVKKFYRLTMDDGAQVEASEDHLWAYKLPNHLRPGTKKSIQREFAKKELWSDQPNERWANLRVGSTHELIEWLNKGFRPRIPLTEPVLYAVNGRTGTGKLDPYLMGLFLGDGCARNLIMTACDDEIRDFLVNAEWFASGTFLHTDGKPKHWLPGPEQRRILDQWLRNNEMRTCRAWEKFLPKYTLTAPIDFRLSVLQGLMDSDGYVDDRGRCYFTSTSERLAKDVQQLVWGLGGKAFLRIKHPTYSHNGEKKNGRLAYDLLIQLRKSSSLFRLTRKQERCTDSWNGGYETMRAVQKIEEIGDKDCACIRVDSVYGLFLTNDFIVTHNSDCAIGRQIRGAVKWGHAWNGLMIRRKYKDLGEIRRRFDELIRMGMPAERVGGPQQTNYVRFLKGPSAGAVITLAAIKMLEQADDWVGHQFTEITIDEAPTFPFLALLIDKLRGSLRSPHGVPTHIFMTGNPGGPGASVVKLMFVDADPTGTGTVRKIEDEDPRTGEKSYITQAFIRSTLEDNKILCENDPKYVAGLRAIRDPNLRAAWLEGRWDVYIGQAFTFSLDRHVLKPEQQIWPIPDHVPIYMTFDWGYGAPFSVGWWWVDNDDRIYRFGEWYGWNGVTPNIGMRMTDPRIAEGILFRERQMGILGRKIIRLCDPTCQNRKPNYMGGGQGPSTIEEFMATAKDERIIAEYGQQNLQMLPGDANRALKIRQFRNRLDLPDNPNEMPMMVIYSNCEHFIRTVPALCVDEENPEELEDKQENHCFDESCHVCMARPIGVDLADVKLELAKEKKKEEIQQLDTASRAAQQEFFSIRRNIADGQAEYTGQDPGAIDPSLDPTVYGLRSEDFEEDIDDIFGVPV